jgi:HK97 family phage portal protein
MALLKQIWDSIAGSKQPNPLDNYLLKWIATNAIYPEFNTETNLNAYLGNNDVFTIINKITEPASVVPIFQYDKNGEEIEGKMIARLNNPNGYQSRAQMLEAAITNYLLFGNSYTVEETVEGSLSGLPARLDVLPSQFVTINLGTVFNPVTGYSFYPMSGNLLDYEKDNVFHWKEFNPDYTVSGGHLKGMSRLRPLLKSITGSSEAYNSLVKAFQNQGAWGILTMLGDEGSGMELTKEQLSALKNKFRADAKYGKLTVTGNQTKWEKIGLTMVEMEVLSSLGLYKGNIADAYNVPSQLLSGSKDRTYNNYKEAERALWTNAICPTVDAYLEGLTKFLAPKFKEEGTYLQADYSGIEALQRNLAEQVTWMVNSKCFTKNEIREAAGYETIPTPEMDMIYDSAGMMPLSELSTPPDQELTEGVLKSLKISDYRK